MHTATRQEVTPEWLRMNSAESYSGLGRSTLTRLISAGELRASKVGRSIRVSRASIDDYMAQHVLGADES